MKLSLGQAAKECGRSKATISKALKSGKLSFINKTSAGYEIDPAELFRVFPKKNHSATIGNDTKPLDVTTDIAMELGKSRAMNEALEAQIQMLRETVEREKANADDWKKQAQAQTALLTDQRSKERGGFWPFKKTG